MVGPPPFVANDVVACAGVWTGTFSGDWLDLLTVLRIFDLGGYLQKLTSPIAGRSSLQVATSTRNFVGLSSVTNSALSSYCCSLNLSRVVGNLT